MSTSSLGRQKSISKRMPEPQSVLRPLYPVHEPSDDTTLEPCAATQSLFIYSQESSVLCCEHGSLQIRLRFDGHSQPIQFISIDNVSERGSGRLAVTYDVGKTAIVWDISTGAPMASFAAYEAMTTASWMRNGNIVFGK